jgi:hypothetical protein
MRAIVRPLAVAALSLAAFSSAYAASDAADAAKNRADAQYKAAMERCEPMKGNAQDVCEKEAKAARDKAKADVSTATKGTAESRADAGETKAKADYDVAMERCESLSGKDQNACESKAKAALDQRQADADKKRKN